MLINQVLSDDVVVAELGRRLARLRGAQNLRQDEFAEKAGVGRSTIQRLERGESIQLTSFVKILRALDRLDALEAVFPEEMRSPLADLRRARSRDRQRVRHRGAVPTWSDQESA